MKIDPNTARLLDKIGLLERANEQQMHTINRLNRKTLSQERALKALEARLAAQGSKNTRTASGGPEKGQKWRAGS